MNKNNTVTHTYGKCPNENCHGEWQIDHLFNDYKDRLFKSKWSCSQCLNYYEISFTFINDQLNFCAESTGEKVQKKIVILELPPQEKPVRLMAYVNRYDHEKILGGNDQYFYEEHTCPTNWIKDVALIENGGDTDPHYMFKYIDTFDGNDVDIHNDSKLVDLLKQAVPSFKPI
jgi:hypothetical protein